MTQEGWELWLRIFRDLLIVGLGTFMLVFETAFVPTPNLDIIAAGAALLGLPPVLRLDVRASGNGTRRTRRRLPGRPSPPDEDDFEERWSHME